MQTNIYLSFSCNNREGPAFLKGPNATMRLLWLIYAPDLRYKYTSFLYDKYFKRNHNLRLVIIASSCLQKINKKRVSYEGAGIIQCSFIIQQFRVIIHQSNNPV